MWLRGVVNRYHASFGTKRQKVQFLPPRHGEREKAQSKALVKIGEFVSGFGTLTITEGFLTRHGELGSIGAFIGGTGVVMILTGIRKRGKI